MSRPKDADPQETRSRILDCACNLLSESAESFSLRAVARRANVSVGTLQYHFADKRTLVDACIDTVYGLFAQEIPRLAQEMAKATDREDTIARAVRFGFRYCRGNMPFIRILEAMIVQNGGLDLTRHKSTQAPLMTAVTGFLGKSLPLPEGEIRLRVNTIILVIGRYAILHEDALRDIFEPPEGKELLESVEEHLISIAVSLLGPDAKVPEVVTRGAGEPRSE